PERLTLHQLEVALLPAAPALAVDDASDSLRLLLEKGLFLGAAAGPHGEPLQTEIGRRRKLGGGGGFGIRVDERHLDRVGACRDEEKLLAVGETARDDRRHGRVRKPRLSSTRASSRSRSARI